MPYLLPFHLRVCTLLLCVLFHSLTPERAESAFRRGRGRALVRLDGVLLLAGGRRHQVLQTQCSLELKMHNVRICRTIIIAGPNKARINYLI